MIEFRYQNGAVYIFENSIAQRVKVGMTTNNVILRLEDVNDMWLEQKVTCQICGGRRLANYKGFIPRHEVSGRKCPGGNELPLEKDVTLAESHLKSLKSLLNNLSGSEKNSVTRIINNLEKRIEKYRYHKQLVGKWEFRIAFYTKCAEQVELLSHKKLEKYLDKQAPFGEVFCCSVTIATEAIETVLNQLGLLQYTRIETKLEIM